MTVEDTGVIAHQIDEQYRSWCGDEDNKQIFRQEACELLQTAAEKSPQYIFDCRSR